jgi:hypothetical protein
MSCTPTTKLRALLMAGCLGLSVMACGGGDDDHGGDGALTAPAEPKAMLVAGPAVHLTWKDIATEHHYTVERKVGTGNFVEFDTTLINTTQYHDANKGEPWVPGLYTYRIAGSGADGTKGPYSAEVSATVP